MPLIQEADRLGFHSVWTAEAYGSDAVTPLAWIAAQTERIHVGTRHHADAGAHAGDDGDDRDDARPALRRPLPARPRRLRAAGRRGLARRRRTASRSCARASTSRSSAQIWAREKPLEHQGDALPDPVPRRRTRPGLGKPLKSILHGRQIPIYIAAIGPKSVAQAAEIADGWLPIFYSPFRAPKVYQGRRSTTGFAKAGGGKSLRDFDIAAVGDGHRQRRRPGAASTSSSRCSRSTSAAWARAARTSTTTSPAATASRRRRRRSRTSTSPARRTRRRPPCPTSSPTRSSLVGPKERIRDRLAAWRESPVGTLNCGTQRPETLRFLAETLL